MNDRLVKSLVSLIFISNSIGVLSIGQMKKGVPKKKVFFVSKSCAKGL